MSPTGYRKIALTCAGTAFLLLASASFRGEGIAHSITVSVISDAAPGLASRHGLNKLISAIKARSITVEQVGSLEEARGTILIVAGQSSASGAAAALHKSMGIEPPKGAESLLIRQSKWKGKTAWLVSGADDRGLMYGLLDVADRVGWAADPGNPFSELHDVAEKPFVAERGV